MKRPVALAGTLALALVLVLSACPGGGGGTDDRSGYDLVVPDYGSDAAADAHADPGSGIDVDAPGHPHPYWKNATWDGFWPGSEQAEYHATLTRQGNPGEPPLQVDLVTKVMDAIPLPWTNQGAWTRIAFGALPQPGAGGKDALALFVNRDDPWHVRVAGLQAWSLLYTNPDEESFEAPIDVPLDLPAGQFANIDATVRTKSSTGDIHTGVKVHIDVQAMSWDAPCPAPFEAPSGCAQLRFTLSGELYGSQTLYSEAILHPTQRILSWTNAAPFASSMTLEAPGWAIP